MPFLLVIIGLILIVAAVRGTHTDLALLLRNDFSGPNNFFIWLLAIAFIGAIGAYGPARSTSRAFIGLLLVVMLLSNRGFFTQLFAAFQQLKGAPSAGSGVLGNLTTGTGAAAGGSNAGGAVGNALGQATGALSALTGNVGGLISGAKGLFGAVKSVGSFLGGFL